MSSQFRYQPDVPLIIPEINIDELAKYQRPVLIANPNCSSAQLLLILKNIHTEFNISLLNILECSDNCLQCTTESACK